MNKDNTSHFFVSMDATSAQRAFATTGAESNSHALDERMPRLLVLLAQLEKSLCALEPLHESNLTEIVYGAIHLCGFIDPAEAEYAIAAALEALESRLIVAEMSTLRLRNTAPS